MFVAMSRRTPPGPRGYPLVGAFPKARHDPLGFFTECARRYGDVVSMRLGVHHVYLLSHPDHVKHVLQDNARAYAKGPTATRVRALFGDSLTMIDGDRWRQRRRQAHLTVQPGHPGHFPAVVARAAAQTPDPWPRLADRPELVEVASEVRRLPPTSPIRAP